MPLNSPGDKPTPFVFMDATQVSFSAQEHAMRSLMLLLITWIFFLQSGCNRVDVAEVANQPPQSVMIEYMDSDDKTNPVDSSQIQLGQVWAFKLRIQPKGDGVGIPYDAITWTGRVEFSDESCIRLGDVVPILPGFSGEEKHLIKRSCLREIAQVDADELPAMRDKCRRMLME